MSDTIPKKLHFKRSDQIAMLLLFALSIESCSSSHSNSSQLSEPRDQPSEDIHLMIILFGVTSSVLLAIVLCCVFRWCYKKYCRWNRGQHNTGSSVCVNHSAGENVYCERHCIQCLEERGGLNPLAAYRQNLSHFPQQMYAQPPHVLESQTQNNLSLPQATADIATISQTMQSPNIVSYNAGSDLSEECAEGHINLNDDILSQLSVDSLQVVEGTWKELLIPTEKSVVKTVAGKSLIYITHEVNDKGDVLTLDSMGVSLHIPRNAVKIGRKQPITLAMSWDLSDAPLLDSSEAHVSPVIFCGPHGLKLEKPCILSYKHCGYDPKNITVKVSETEITDEKKWELLVCANEGGGKCVVTQDECHIRMNHFSLVTSTQLAAEGNVGKKWVQVAVFASPLEPTVNHYHIRVYFFNKTPCNLQWAIYHEAQFGGKLVCPEKTFLFSGGGEDMRIKLHYLSSCWIPVDDTGSDSVSFRQIWHNQCPHASLCFKRSERHKTDCQGPTDEINIQFLIFQNNHEDEKEKIIIHMANDRALEDISDLKSMKHGFESVNIHLGPSSKSGHGSPIVRLHHTPSNPHDIRVEVDNEEMDLDEIQNSLSERQMIPVVLKTQLVLMLDPRCPFHHDWRELASRLGLDRTIPFLEGKYSPTSIILQHMENKGKTLLELYSILKEMEREDAASFVEKYLRNPPNRVATESEVY